MSLVAAVAVAGLTSSVSAQDLSEAIKGVDVSGNFRYRVQEDNTKNGAHKNATDVEIEVGVKAPITDTVTAVFKIDNANNDTDTMGKADVEIEDYYFSYQENGLTVNFGQQNLPGRITDATQGDGVVVTKNIEGFTIGAAAFITNSFGSEEAAATDYAEKADDVYSVFASGKVGPLSLAAQFADVADTATTLNATIGAKVGMVNLFAEHTKTNWDDAETAGLDDASLLKLQASAKIDALSIKGTFLKTGDDNSATNSSSLDSGSEAKSEYLLWLFNTTSKADLNAYTVDATYSLNDKVSFRAGFADGEYTTANTEITEKLGQINYKVAKNLNTYFRLSELEDGTTDKTMGRIEVKYTF
jgi:hypothetical protein